MLLAIVVLTALVLLFALLAVAPLAPAVAPAEGALAAHRLDPADRAQAA